jgi:hypothetical protein
MDVDLMDFGRLQRSKYGKHGRSYYDLQQTAKRSLTGRVTDRYGKSSPIMNFGLDLEAQAHTICARIDAKGDVQPREPRY